MTNKTILVSLVAIFALTFLVLANVSALTNINSVEVNGVEALNGAATIGVTGGETLAVKVVFYATDNASDVRLKLWVSGGKDLSATSDSFDVIAGRTYSKIFAVTVPSNIDPSEDTSLFVDLESKSGLLSDLETISLTAQRESYNVEILSANVENTVSAGKSLALDVVLKNAGSHKADNTFVTVKITALGLEQTAYFGDMSAVDQSNPDMQDAAERRMLINIPNSAKAGVYLLEIDAYNSDSSSVVTKKIAIGSSGADSSVVSSTQSKSFGVGQKATYTFTLVNSGDKIQSYELSSDSADSALNVAIDDSVVVVPAGSSKTVQVVASASKTGRYDFAVNVLSNGAIVQSQSFIANVDGSSSSAFAGSAAVVLTVVLAIIFVVLLVVLIVLLTRKPEKTQEIGESYY
ncbi:MAG: hypothetical protein WCK29_02795 [archaeon]